jgi:hypothetical protein
MLNWRAINDPFILVGLFLGLIGIIASVLFTDLFPGRYPGDPLPLLLIVTWLIGGLSHGLSYLDWHAPVIHVGFMLGLSLATVFLLRYSISWEAKTEELSRAGRVALLVSYLLPAISEIDSWMVGVWYLASGYLSLTLSSLIMRWVAGRLGGRTGR